MIIGEGARLGAEAARRLAQTGCCEIAPGLTDAEFDRIERTYGFEFADDHRAFLAAGLPVNVPFEPEPGVYYAWERPWPEWRDGDPGSIVSVWSGRWTGSSSTWNAMGYGMTPGAFAPLEATRRWRPRG